MLHFVQHDSKGSWFSVIVRWTCFLSMGGYYFMEKLCIMSGLSMKRWGLVEKRGCREVGEAQSRRSEPFGVARTASLNIRPAYLPDVVLR